MKCSSGPNCQDDEDEWREEQLTDQQLPNQQLETSENEAGIEPDPADPVFALSLEFYYRAELNEAVIHLKQVLSLNAEHNQAAALQIQVEMLRDIKDRGKY